MLKYLLCFFPFVLGGQRGADLSVPCDEDQWACLKEAGVNFGLVRAFRSIGEVDKNSPSTIHAAHQAGISNLHVYMFPCVPSSNYNVANNVTCPSPEMQVEKTVNFLLKNQIRIRRQHEELDGHENEVVALRLWFDVEDETNPTKYFDDDVQVNQNFMKQLQMQAVKMDIPIGVYTTKTYWSNIMGDSNAFGDTPLWYPKWDGIDDMSFFTPFGGWQRCAVKQTVGNAQSAQGGALCGLAQVDLDYAELRSDDQS
jgi:hypothetical protein